MAPKKDIFLRDAEIEREEYCREWGLETSYFIRPPSRPIFRLTLVPLTAEAEERLLNLIRQEFDMDEYAGRVVLAHERRRLGPKPGPRQQP